VSIGLMAVLNRAEDKTVPSWPLALTMTPTPIRSPDLTGIPNQS